MHRRLLALLSLSTGLFTLATAAAPVYRDVPFLQAVAGRITTLPELQGATFLRVALDREGIVYVLTDRGVARVFDERLGMDHSVISRAQASIYAGLRDSGAAPTLLRIAKAEIQAMQAGGASLGAARALMRRALQDLRDSGLNGGPWRWPGS